MQRPPTRRRCTMADFLLIESRDPFESEAATREWAELAGALARDGHRVTVFLVQRGVSPARTGTGSRHLGALAKGGVAVLADEFSRREPGIARDRLVSGIVPSPLDVVVERMAAGHKVIWH